LGVIDVLAGHPATGTAPICAEYRSRQQPVSEESTVIQIAVSKA
jgi:hypothetical protein